MLVSFSVENFRSFHAKQTFSLIGEADKSLRETNCIQTPFRRAEWIHATDGIFGANASGKTNLYLALLASWYFVQFSSAQTWQQWGFARHQPFAFSDDSNKSPTEFEICFIQDEKMYWLTIAYTKSRIVKESLYVQENVKRVLLYNRTVDPTDEAKDTWEWGSSLEGKKITWRDLTRPDALFLSTAVQFNSEQLAIPHKWFANNLYLIAQHSNSLGTQVTDQFVESDKQRVLTHLKKVDFGLIDAAFEDETMQSLALKLTGGSGPEGVVSQQSIKILRFTHESPLTHKTAKFLLQEESAGTNTFYKLIGQVLKALDNGATLFIDEIDTSLHPQLVSYIVQLFNSKEHNKKNAQLIFITHDATQFSQDTLRRDQIWIFDKEPSLQSRVYPLSSFSPRKGEAILKGYLAGRYGGIPYIE